MLLVARKFSIHGTPIIEVMAALFKCEQVDFAVGAGWGIVETLL